MGKHYIPRYYLSGFTQNSKPPLIWVYEKGSFQVFATQIKNVAHETYYFPDNLETYLANDIEAPANIVLRRIRERKIITAKDKIAFSNYMAVLWKRVPEGKKRLKERAPKVSDRIRKKLFEEIEELKIKNPSKANLLEKRRLEAHDCFPSTQFGQLMIFSKLWFAYNKTKQGDMHEYHKESIP